jgi:hypothetical protein
MKTLDAVDAASLKADLPDFRAGDTVKVRVPTRITTSLQNGVNAITFHSGQVCCDATRWIVHKKIYKDFVDECKSRLRSVHVGYQMDDASGMGPVVNAKQRQRVARQREHRLREGAQLARERGQQRRRRAERRRAQQQRRGGRRCGGGGGERRDGEAQQHLVRERGEMQRHCESSVLTQNLRAAFSPPSAGLVKNAAPRACSPRVWCF